MNPMTSFEFCSGLLSFEIGLHKFAYRLNLTKDDADDLVQDTFLKALQKRDKYIETDNFKSWAFTIMKNTFVDNYRKNLIRKALIDKTGRSILINQTQAISFEEPDSTYSALEITQKIDQLNDKLRTPLKLYLEGYKYSEIADVLNLKLGTVKNRIFLSRKQLRNQLNS
jgi:RNA polymerase sigma factor (sigma-70 family)